MPFTEGGAIIEVGSVEKIAASLGHPLRGSVPFRQTWEYGLWYEGPDAGHPLGQISTLTTPDNPAVLFDDSAAFCSPVITFDREGRALHLHDGIIGDRDDLDYIGYAGDTARRYFEVLPEYVGSEGVTSCISGLNGVASSNDIADHVEQRIRSHYPKVDFHSFVSKQFPHQQRRSNVVPDGTTSKGFLYVP